MYKTTAKWACFLLLDLVVAGVLVGVHFLWPTQLIYLNHGSDRPTWLNVTPGHPDTVPLFPLMRYSPWPLPAEQNFSAITWVTLAPDRPVTLRGKANAVRYWSFVFYPHEADKHSRAMPALESSRIEVDADGSYVVTLCGGGGGKNCLDTGGASSGILFMRNYVPLRGRPITLPAVYWGDRLVVPAKEYAHAD